MEYFCENCVSEVNQQLCRGCHIMLKDGKAVYSNFMPTKAALKSAELAATVPAVAAANTQSKPCYINHGDLKLNNPTWDYCPKCRLLLDCSAR